MPQDHVPRGNGTNIHLISGGYVFVQDNINEITNMWHARRQSGTPMVLTGQNGKREVIAPDNISRLEEL